MTLPASGVISWEDICAEFSLDASTAIFPTNFYGLGGAPASGVLKFSDFYGRSASLISATSTSVTSTAASRTITVPSFAINDTAVVVILTRGSSNTLTTTSTGWRKVSEGSSSGATSPTSMSIFACENTTVANRALVVAGFPTTGHVQTAYIVKKGGTLDDTKDAAPSGAASNNPGATGTLTAASSWLVIALATCASTGTPVAPTGGFTLDATTWARDASNYSMLTAWKQLTGAGATVDPGPFTGITETSSRAVSSTLALNMSTGAGYAATYTPTAGAVSADNSANSNNNATKTFTASKAVTWTFTVTSGAATCNHTSGYSGTSVKFDLAPGYSDATSTVSITATDSLGNATNWTLTLTAYKLPAATYTPTASSQSASNSADTTQPASVTITASRSVTWTWTRTGSTAATASIASGGSGSTITFSLTSTTTSRTSTFNVTANDGYTNKTYTVTLTAAANATTYTPAAGSYFDDNSANTASPATFTVSASASVAWTWSSTGSTGLTSTVASGGSATSITFNLSSALSADRDYTITLQSGGKTWTIELVAYATNGGGVGMSVMTL
jgi:hypothetical protein